MGMGLKQVKADLAQTESQTTKGKISPKFSLATLIATWFYSGMSPLFPGTIGSLAVFPLYLLLLPQTGDYVLATSYFRIATLCLFIIGWIAVTSYQKQNDVTDHKSIVIDEVIGMMVVFSIAFYDSCIVAKYIYEQLALRGIEIAFELLPFLVAFMLFRFFDILKPLGIKLIDRKIKNAFGVIFDDMVAGVYAGIVIILLSTFLRQKMGV